MTLHMCLAIVHHLLLHPIASADLDLKQFVHKNIFLDDVIMSLPNVSYETYEPNETHNIRHEGETRLHKITSYTSYKAVVMGTFDVNDHGEQLKDRDCDDTDHNPLFFKEFVYVYVADCKK